MRFLYKFLDKKIINFMVLSTILAFVIFIVASVLFVMLNVAGRDMYRIITFSILSFFAIIFLWVISSMVLILLVYKNMAKNRVTLAFAKGSLNLFFPLFEFASGFFGLDKDLIRGFYITVNNVNTESGNKTYRNDEILIILPHCIQNNECGIKITNNLDACRLCGKCEIKDVVEIAKKYDVKTFVVTGGTAARNAVKNAKPKLIISVACERDLSSGILDVSGIPVVGIVNERPYGSCFNTTFDAEKLRKTLEKALGVNNL